MTASPTTEILVARGSALSFAVFTLLFVISLLFPTTKVIDYATSMGVAISLVTLAAANEVCVKDEAKLVYAKLATPFAAIYCTYVCLVYFTQLTFVRLADASPEALSIVAFEPNRTVFYALDMLGYGFMSVAVFWIGLSLPHSLVQKLMIAVAILGGTCVAVPFLPSLYEEANDEMSSVTDVASLVVWAGSYVPVMFLLSRQYQCEHTISGYTRVSK